MRKIFLFILALISCSSVFAQNNEDWIVVFEEDQSVEVTLNNHSKKTQIGGCVQFDKQLINSKIATMFFRDKIDITNPKEHLFYHNGKIIRTNKGSRHKVQQIFTNPTLTLEDTITLKYADTLSVYRKYENQDSVLCCLIVMPYKWEEKGVRTAIQNEIRVSESVFFIKDKQPLILLVPSIPGDMEIKGIKMKIGNKSINGSINNEKVSFNVPETVFSDDGAVPVQLLISVYDSVDRMLFKDLLVEYGKVQKQPESISFWERVHNGLLYIWEWGLNYKLVSIPLAIGLVIIIICLMIKAIIRIVRKRGKKCIEYRDMDGNPIRVFCQQDQPNAGDAVETKMQKFVTTKEGVYAFDIKKEGRNKSIDKVYYVVPISKDVIYVDKCTLSNGDSLNSYVTDLIDGTRIQIVSGAKVKNSGGEYEIDDDRILKIETKEDGNCIRIISKKKDKQEETPQLPVSSDTKTVALTDSTNDEKEQDKKPNEELKALNARVSELESELNNRPTQQEKEELLDKLHLAETELAEIKIAKTKLENNTKELEQQARKDERAKVDLEYRKKIATEYVSRKKYNEDTGGLRTQVNDANAAKEKAEKDVQSKNDDIKKLKDKANALQTELNNKNEEIVREKASGAALRKSALKKNMHYLFKVQEVLDDISNSIADVYKDMTNTKIKEGLIAPIVKGVSGLSAGVLSWGEDYKANVIANTEVFFGKDVLAMDEYEVKEKLSKDFVSTIVKSDGFSKLVRLYHLSKVPFIRKQFVEGGMNLLVLEQLYFKTFALVSDFGYTIQCPVLFEDQFDEMNYSWYGSTSLFNYVILSEKDKSFVKDKGANVIVDVTQIGYTSQWGTRKATVVTPDF